MGDSGPVTAAVIIIGNEVLSGRTVDANLSFLAKALNEVGVRVREARIIPDDEGVIVSTVNACRDAFDYVLTTGGIGPTHDDITSASIAKAFGCGRWSSTISRASSTRRGERWRTFPRARA